MSDSSAAAETDDPTPKSLGIEHLFAQGAWEDAVLQSYRGLLLTTQSILLAVGTALLGVVILSEKLLQALIAASFQTALVLAAVYFAWQMRAVITERGQRVSLTIGRILWAERQLPPDLRYVTLFKYLQRSGRSLSEYYREPAFQALVCELERQEWNDYDRLLEPDLPRRLFSRDVYIGILFIWMSLLISSWLYTAVAVA